MDPEPFAGALRAPLMSAFLLLAHRAGLGVEDVCRPPVALELAALARRELDPWTDYAENARREVVARTADIDSLASAVLTEPAARWWTEPLRLDRQVWVGSSGDGTRQVRAPHGPATPFEVYAQRPHNWFVTATDFDGCSALHTTLAYQVGDWEPSFPLPQARLTRTPPARVYEINTADDWHNLVVRYGTPNSSASTANGPAGIAAGGSPVWVAVARDWDAVHLSFGGFLSAAFVAAGPPDNLTTLWTWDCEQTVWLRDPVGAWVELPPLEHRPEPSIGPVSLQLHAAEPGRSTSRAWLRSASETPLRSDGADD